MLKHLPHGVAALVLGSASALACASQPIALNDQEMDMVAAGAVTPVPTVAQFQQIGAMAWATTSVTASPGYIFVIEGNAAVKIGLAGNSITFAPRFQIIRT